MGCCGQKRLSITPAPIKAPTRKQAQQLLEERSKTMMETIQKTSKAVFRVNVGPKTSLDLFFVPFISKFNLKPPFLLFHLFCEFAQGKTAGIYDGTKDEYYVCDLDKLNINAIPKILALDGRTANSLPLICFLFKEDLIVEGNSPNQRFVIGK